uniref:Hint domain-containing protein n=4 Tax=Rhodoblastus sp. TaxID=1962975 RepID=UPI003FD8B138
APGTSISLSTLFTYSAASGDTVVGFDFDETTNNGGYITDNNGNRLSSGFVYGQSGTGIPISELGLYHYVVGSAGTSDNINFNVEDQYTQLSTRATATVSATAQIAEPTLSKVFPEPVPAIDAEQIIKLYGSNFTSGDKLLFTYSNNVTTPNLNPITVVANTEIDYTYFNNGNDAGTWNVQVESPDGTLSNAVQFLVNAPSGPVDEYHSYNNATPTVANLVGAAESYIGTEWGAYNCTGLVWAIADAVGADFYESAATVANIAGESILLVRSIVPDAGGTNSPANPSGFTDGYDQPNPNLLTYGDWSTFVSTGWATDDRLQIGDIVRIPLTLPDGTPVNAGLKSPHSFIVVGGDQQNGWEVIDNTITTGDNNATVVPITEHNFNNTASSNKFYNEILHASYAYVSYLSTSAACYCRGTLIATEKGEVAVEDLTIGDRVLTKSGALRPIKWIGTRAYSVRFARNNPDLLPIRFKAGSLAENVPARDLFVSPHHAMFLDGVLIPAEHLVNGATIVQEAPGEDIHYFHIELESHDVLIAEGALSESFVDDDSRGMFQNAHEFRALYPGERQNEAVYCAPRVEDGYALDRVRRRLAERAGLVYPAATDFGALLGVVEHCDDEGVSGWALNTAYPNAPVCLDVIVDGAFVGFAYTEAERPNGDRGFDLRFAPALDRSCEHKIELRRSADGARLGAGLFLGANAAAADAAA